MAKGNHDIKARLLATFQAEAEEHLQAIWTNLLLLERGLPPTEAREAAEAAFREVHTLKGAARSVSLMGVEALCQACESVLSRITRGQLALIPPILESLYQAVDGVARLVAGGNAGADVHELVRRLERASREPAAEAAGTIERPEQAGAPTAVAGPGLPPPDTIRLATAKLDRLLLRAEDLLVPKLAAGERIQGAKALVEALTGGRMALGRALAAQGPGGAYGSVASMVLELESGLRAVEAQAREMLGQLIGDQRSVTKAVDGLQDEMRRLRMMPVATMLDLFPRMVRDLAGEQGKEVEWVARGTDLEVDRKVLEAVKDPLIHLVRNAIDHGIEPPEARAEAGKPPRGRVAVSFGSLEGNRIEISVEDDGRGIEPERVRAAAVRSRLLTEEEARNLTEEAALDLIYRSGFTTSPIITDVSGHGLGLAIVKERVERLEGQVHVRTRVGAGTTVWMVLPATIAAFRGLLVSAGGQLFLLPTEAVERVLRLAPEADGHPLSVARLSGLLGLPERAGQPDPGSPHPCVVVRSGEERMGLLVEEVLGDREGLIKELGAPLVRVRNVAGAALLGTGQVVLILRAADLFRSIPERPRLETPPAAHEETGRQPVVLVVDDSITTRTVEKNLLEAAGYQVRVAVDGVEGWTALRSEEVDLVVSDVDMPRMDGFELTARIRADRKLADLPVVLVTALESREDKERGIEVGANAYIIKSSFDQSNLLEIIRRLV